jgi:amino acid transporter
MLSALTEQILVLMYILVFAAVLRLRYTQPDAPRPYKVPGGKVGIWVISGMGLLGSVFGLIIGFVPPSGIKHWPTPVYVAAMAAAIVICSAPPFIIERIKKPSWTPAHPDEVLLDLDADAPSAAPVLPTVAAATQIAGIAGANSAKRG